MPVVNIKLTTPLPSEEKLADLARKMTDLFTAELGKDPARVVISFEPINPAHICFGGVSVAAARTAAIAASAEPKWRQEGSGELFKIGIISCSDRASSGEYEDISGPAAYAQLAEWLRNPLEGHYRLISDECAQISATICELAALGCDLIVTTGGTGPAARDVTPEACAAVCDRFMDGFGEQMRAASLKHVPTAILSRQSAAVRGSSLVLNLPGKPKAIAECLEPIWGALGYAIDLIGGASAHSSSAAPCEMFRPKK